MSLMKAEMKLALLKELGCDLEDDKEAAERDSLRSMGRVQASVTLQKEITKIMGKLDMDMESDAPPFTSLEAHTQAKRYLACTLAACVTMTKQSENLRLQMEGKAIAFKHTMERLSRRCKAEEAKAEALKEVVVELTKAPKAPKVAKRPRGRPTGRHPGPSLAAQRKAEAAES